MSTAYAVLLEYQGESFEGWQIQTSGSRTVQGCLVEALSTLSGESVHVRGSGRTDAGVHAEGQVASFALEKAWETDRLLRALNGLLPPEIGALQVAHVAEGFDALRAATGPRLLCRCHLRRPSSPNRGRRDPTALPTAAALRGRV